jgi:hypothetical protein
VYYRDDFIVITRDPGARLDVFVKKSIGAFWGRVFRCINGYGDKKSVSVSMSEYFGVKTATCFGSPKEKFTLDSSSQN